MLLFSCFFQPLSPTSNAPIPPPRRKHPQNLKLDRIKEGGSFDLGSKTPPTVEKTLKEKENKSPDTKSNQDDIPDPDKNIEETKAEIEYPSEEKAEEDKNTMKRVLAKRTVSLPIVQVPEEVLSSSPLSERSLSHEGLHLQTTDESDVNFKDSIDSDHVKVIESEPETKTVKEPHHSRKISMKNIKKKFKHRTKKVKTNEYTSKSATDSSDPNSGPVSPAEQKVDFVLQTENGKGSETDDNAFTDDDITSPTVEQQHKMEKEGGFLRRMSVKVKNLMIGHDHPDDENDTKKYKVTVIDLTEDNNNSKMVIHKMTMKELFQSQQGRLWYKHRSHFETKYPFALLTRWVF